MRLKIKAIVLLCLMILSVFTVFFSFVPMVMAAPEDYTSYTEVDVNDHITYEGTNHINYRPLESEDCYAYFDYGINYFTDFIHHVDGMAEDSTAGHNMLGIPWCVANDLDDALGLYTNQKTHIVLGIQRKSTETHMVQIFVRERHGAVANLDNTGWVLEEDTWYFLKIEKNGTSLICDIYSTAGLRDAGEGSDGDVDILSITLEADHNFRYIYSANNYHAVGSEYWEGEFENLDLLPVGEDATPPFFSDIGYENQNITNRATNFSCVITDATSNISHAVFSWNASGSWVNRTAYDLGDDSSSVMYNRTEILPHAGFLLGFRFYANDSLDNWGVSSITAFIVILEVTFRYNSTRGLLRVNGTDAANGTTSTYLNNTVLELTAIVYNSSFSFLNFTWFLNSTADSGNSLYNPYNLTLINKNHETWAVFGLMGVGAAERGEYLAVGIAVSLILIPLLIFLAWVLRRRR